MPPKRECTVVLLDVGPRMHPHVEYAARAVSDFLMSKILHKKEHEAALVLFGAPDTRNSVHDEYAAEGDEGQYLGIVEQHGMAHPNDEYLKLLHTVPRDSQGRSDFVEALVVALQLLSRPELTTSGKRVLLVSNLCCRVQEDGELAGSLAARLQERGVRLEALLLDTPEDSAHEADMMANRNVLSQICQELSHSERSFACAADLLGAFKAKEYNVTPYYSGPLSFGKMLNIQVKTSSRCTKEKMPPPGKETVHQENLPDAAEGGVVQAKEYCLADDRDKPAEERTLFPLEEVMRAFRYGANLVGVGDEMAGEFRFPTEKGMHVIGFVEADYIPRHHYMSNHRCLVGSKDRQSSCVAIAALVRALERSGRVAILRWVQRDNMKLATFVATPVEGTATSPPHLLLNQLPFFEDARQYPFQTFDKDAWRPSEEQLSAAAKLVASMRLGTGPADEQEAPEATANPALHRLHWELARRVVEPAVPLLEEDLLAQRVFEPRLASMPGAAEAAAALPELFPLGQRFKASRRGRKRIGTDNPSDDFHRLLAEGDIDGAVEGLADAIPHLVLGSLNESTFQLAVRLVDALREACVEHVQPEPFNKMIVALASKCKDAPLAQEFWRKMCLRGIKPIDSKEAEGSQMDAAQAAEWFTQHKLS